MSTAALPWAMAAAISRNTAPVFDLVPGGKYIFDPRLKTVVDLYGPADGKARLSRQGQLRIDPGRKRTISVSRYCRSRKEQTTSPSTNDLRVLSLSRKVNPISSSFC